MTPRPESNSPDSSDTNPLPKVSSAHSWSAMSFPKAAPVIREKAAAPERPLRVRADGTQEICAEDIMLIVPKATAPAPRAKQPSSEEIGDADIVVEEAAPAPAEFRKPAYSINATQEILADDVIEVATAAVAQVHVAPDVVEHRDEIPSTVPWTVDAHDDLEFPTPPTYSGSYPPVAPRRITSYSATQVFRRRSLNVKVVIASVGLAAGVVLVSGIARLAQVSGASGSTSSGPVGISMQAPKSLDTTVRTGALAYGSAPHVQETVAVSIDALPSVSRTHAWRWHRRH